MDGYYGNGANAPTQAPSTIDMQAERSYVTGRGGIGGASLAQTPQESGLISAVKDLMDAVNDNANATLSVKDALGLSLPQPPSNEKNSSAPSMAQILRSAVYRIRETTQHLYDLRNHITS